MTNTVPKIAFGGIWTRYPSHLKLRFFELQYLQVYLCFPSHARRAPERKARESAEQRAAARARAPDLAAGAAVSARLAARAPDADAGPGAALRARLAAHRTALRAHAAARAPESPPPQRGHSRARWCARWLLSRFNRSLLCAYYVICLLVPCNLTCENIKLYAFDGFNRETCGIQSLWIISLSLIKVTINVL